MAGFTLKTRLDAVPTPEEAFGELFGTGGGIRKLKITDLKPFPNQPFKLYTTEKLQELAADIAANGILSPIIVRTIPPDENNQYLHYQILAGHNRVKAAQLVGLTEMPAIVKDVDDDTAKLIMVNTNLNQRQELLASEKAWAYRIQMEASKRKSGERTDLVHNVHKVDTTSEIAAETKESRRNIAYFIRLTYLSTELLELVDNNVLPFRAGVELSYILPSYQEILTEYLKLHKCKISIEQAESLRKYFASFDEDIEKQEIEKVLNKVFERNAKVQTKIDTKSFVKFIPQTCSNAKDIEKYIIKALEFYKQNTETP